MSGMGENDRLLADFACLDPIYVDGVAAILNLGPNFQMLFFRWVPTRSEHGVVTMEKAPAASIIRPKNSIVLCSQRDCAFLKSVDALNKLGQPEVPLH
jgi:hypothetical protein